MGWGVDSFSPQLPQIREEGIKLKENGGAWVAQSVKRPTSAQVMISYSVSLSPTLGSALTAQSLEPASHSALPPLMVCLSLSLPPQKINKQKKKKLKEKNTVFCLTPFTVNSLSGFEWF